MAFCSKCGAQLPEGSRFCTNCGTPVEPVEPVREGPISRAPEQNVSAEPEAGQENEAVPVQGSYTAPTVGSYTAPNPGGYTAPNQSGYGMQPNYGTPGKTKTGSNKSLLIIIGAVAAVILLVILGIVFFKSPGGSKESADPNVGVYEAESASMWGMEIGVKDVYTKGFSIELKDKGKCALNVDGKKGKGKWKLEDGRLYIEGGGMKMEGTLQDGVMTLENLFDTGVDIKLLKEGVSLGGAEAVSDDSEPEEPAVEIPPLPGTWWGWIEYSDCWGKGIEDKFLAAWCYIMQDDSGRWYLEVFADGDSRNSVISMWLEDMEGSDVILPDIGEEDSWVLKRYLSKEDKDLFAKSVSEDGSLSFDFDYESGDGSGGCKICVFLRPDGVLWDEDQDRLPPRYEEYKALLEENGGETQGQEEQAGGDYGNTTADAAGVVEAQVLRDTYHKLDEMTDAGDWPDYSAVEKLFGTPGVKYDDDWTEYRHTYRWKAADTSEWVNVSFRMEDGKETNWAGTSYNLDE